MMYMQASSGLSLPPHPIHPFRMPILVLLFLKVHVSTFCLPQVIKEQQEAIARLVKIAKEDSEDLETIQQGLSNKT